MKNKLGLLLLAVGMAGILLQAGCKKAEQTYDITAGIGWAFTLTEEGEIIGTFVYNFEGDIASGDVLASHEKRGTYVVTGENFEFEALHYWPNNQTVTYRFSGRFDSENSISGTYYYMTPDEVIVNGTFTAYR